MYGKNWKKLEETNLKKMKKEEFVVFSEQPVEAMVCLWKLQFKKVIMKTENGQAYIDNVVFHENDDTVFVSVVFDHEKVFEFGYTCKAAEKRKLFIDRVNEEWNKIYENASKHN